MIKIYLQRAQERGGIGIPLPACVRLWNPGHFRILTEPELKGNQEQETGM